MTIVFFYDNFIFVIYLDNAATTFLDENASEVYSKYACKYFFNPSAIYKQSASIKRELYDAKEVIANAIGTSFNNNIIFTGSATEANNLAVMGSYRKIFGKMLFSSGEHPSIYNTAMELKKRGADVIFVNLTPSGEIDYNDLESKLSGDVSFISIMMVSNETGAINDLHKIAELKNKYCPNAIFHSDLVQGFGKFKINVDYFGLDMATISGHKVFGPKGIGALYVKNKNLLSPIIFGGGQEYNLRSGTENVPAIMALATSVKNFGNLKENELHVNECKCAFLSEIACTKTNNDYINKTALSCKINSNASPYVLSLSFMGVNGETLVHMLEEKDVLISRGSACSSKKAGNRVLENMGLTSDEVLGSVRISFSKYTTIEEAKEAGKILNECYTTLKEKLKWKMYFYSGLVRYI